MITSTDGQEENIISYPTNRRNWQTLINESHSLLLHLQLLLVVNSARNTLYTTCDREEERDERKIRVTSEP